MYHNNVSLYNSSGSITMDFNIFKFDISQNIWPDSCKYHKTQGKRCFSVAFYLYPNDFSMPLRWPHTTHFLLAERVCQSFNQHEDVCQCGHWND